MVFEWMGATIAWRIWTAFKSARVHIPVYLCAVCEVYALCVCGTVIIEWSLTLGLCMRMEMIERLWCEVVWVRPTRDDHTVPGPANTCNATHARQERNKKKLRMSNIKLNSTFADSPIHCIIHTCGMLCYMYVLIYRVSHVCFIDWAHRDREREHLRCAFLRMRFHYICRRASRTDMCHRNQLERPITQLASANNNK